MATECQCWIAHAQAKVPWVCTCPCHAKNANAEPEGALKRSDAEWLVEQVTDLMKAVVNVHADRESAGAHNVLVTEQKLLVDCLLHLVNKE